MNRHRTRGTVGLLIAIVLVAVAALAISACGSSTSSTTSASATPAASGSALDYAALTAAALKPFPETYMGPTTPAKAPKGIKIACITCYSILEGCVTPSKGVAEAAKAIGWQETTYDGGGTPTQQNAQILNAISKGANVIMLSSIDPKAVQSSLKAAEKAGVLIVSGSSGLSEPNPLQTYNTPPAGGVWPAFDIAPDYAALGEKGVDWMVGDAQGNFHPVIYSDKEFPSVLAVDVGLRAGFAKYNVSYPPFNYFTSTQLAVLPASVVSYLRTHPDTNYVFLPFDPAAESVVPAIANAGFNNVKLVSVLGDSVNQKFIQDGKVQAASLAYDNIYMGYAIVDQTIRLLNKQPLSQPIGENLPFVVLDKTNLPPGLGTWTTPLFDYKSEFMKLWQ